MPKNKKLIILSMVILFVVVIIVGCIVPSLQLLYALKDYTNAITKGIPEGTRLTIYYMDPWVLTRMPVSTENLKKYSESSAISVSSAELTNHLSNLERLDALELEHFKGEYYTDARMYYVFEFGDSGKQFEVTINAWYESACVNGVPVEYDPILLEIVFPFLTDDARAKFEFQQPLK